MSIVGHSDLRAPLLTGVVIFDDFEALDVFGPVQMWGRLPDRPLVFVSPDGMPARSAQGAIVMADYSFDGAPQLDLLMVPGGPGTRKLVQDPPLLSFVRKQHQRTNWTTSVCTGAAILAGAGILDGRRATTNKAAFDWVTSQSNAVRWVNNARWVIDGKVATSSGVSAGTDMALAMVRELFGRETADKVARAAEYVWRDDADDDPFATSKASCPMSSPPHQE